MEECIVRIINFIKNEFIIMALAAVPFFELKAAIPFGISIGLHPLHAYFLAVAGSTVPAPVIMLAFRPVFNYIRRTRLFKNTAERLMRRILRKSTNIKRYYAAGLCLFVAIPAPTTGVWTGSMAAAVLNIRLLHALPAILIGNIIAGLIVLAVSCGIIR